MGRRKDRNSRGRRTSPVPPKNVVQRKERTSLLTWFSHLPTGAKVIAAAATLFGTYAAWLSIQPRIAIELVNSAFHGNMPAIKVSNSGFLAASSVTWDCAARANIYVGPHRERMPRAEEITGKSEYANIEYLPAASDTVRFCQQIELAPGQNISPGTVIIPHVTYKSMLWPFEQLETAVFTLEGDDETAWRWEYRGNALSEEEAEQMEEQGYNVAHL